MTGSPPPSSVDRHLSHALLQRLAKLPVAQMRSAALARALVQMRSAQAVWTLEWLIRGVLVKEPAAALLYEGLIDPDPMAAALGPELLWEMAQVGFEHGCVGAQIWLRSGAHVRPGEADDDSSRLVHHQLRELPLGNRRALARRAHGDRLTQLLVDPDPGVIANLLNNARTTEQTVLSICSRRPTVSAPLEAVVRCARWSRRYRVRLALVRNPHLDPKFGVNLLVCLATPDLEAVRDDATLWPALRLAAQRLLDLAHHPDLRH